MCPLPCEKRPDSSSRVSANGDGSGLFAGCASNGSVCGLLSGRALLGGHMELFILAGLVLFLICSGIALLTIWAAGKNSNRGNWDY
jgi:hypothetical protein